MTQAMKCPARVLRCFFIAVAFVSVSSALAQPLTVTLLAGKPNGSGTTTTPFDAARFTSPKGVAVGPAPGTLPIYVIDGNHAVRRINKGIAVPVFAGSASSLGFVDDVGAAARFNQPGGLVVDATGDVFVADTKNHSIRRISAISSAVTTIQGTGNAGSTDGIAGVQMAEFSSPAGIAVGTNNVLFVADTANNTIRKLTFVSGSGYIVSTFAGKAGFSGLVNGTGASARFNKPQGIAVDTAGNVFVADTDNHVIRKITPAGVVSTFVGALKSGSTDGIGTAALFNRPVGVAVDKTPQGANKLYVADTGNHVLRMVTPGKVVTTAAGVAGTAGAVNGEGVAAKFNGLSGVAVDGSGKISVADTLNHTVRGVFGSGRVPLVTVQPKGKVIATGAKVTYSVTATGPADLTITWYRNGAVLTDVVGHIAGAQITRANATTLASTLTISNATAADQGGYKAVIENPFGQVASVVVPLVVTGQTTWLWASAIGGSGDDAALDLLVEQPAGSSLGALWLAARNGGHLLQKHALSNGVRTLSSVIDAKGDGANALVRDSFNGDLFITADIVLSNAGKPGLLVKKNAAAKTLATWPRQFATGRGSNASITSSADGLGLAMDASRNVFLAGYLQGFGKFSSTPSVPGSGIAVGSTASTANHAFLTKYASDGTVLWARDIFSFDDQESLGWDVVTDSAGSAYICGMVGAKARFQLAAAAADDATDFHSETNVGQRPFVAKYDSAGVFQWAYVPSFAGHYLSLHVTAAGEVWVTGFDGDRLDPGQHTAVLARLDAAAGTSLQELRVAGGKGCSLDTDPVRGLAWLVLDSGGLVDYGSRKFGVPGYRVIQVDTSTLAAHWDLPVFGSATLSPLALSEQADIRYGSDGRLYTALTFQDTGLPGAQVEFIGRKTSSLVGRGTDGFIACIAEKPLIDSPPAHELVAKGSPVTLTVVPDGTLTPRYQWYKNGVALAGKTAASLNIASAALTDAAAYTVRLSNGLDSILSGKAEVGVVEVITATRPVAINGSTIITVPSAGTGLLFNWRKNSGALPAETRITGGSTKTLTIKGLLRPDDDGGYDCIVTGPSGVPLTSGLTTLSVKIKPVLNTVTFPNGIVSGERMDGLSAMNDATSFSIVGVLPPGLSFNRLTGVISGKVTVAKTYTFKVIATNVAGSSDPMTVTMVIAPLPIGTSGSYSGVIDRHLGLTGNVGARVDFTVVGSGGYTAKLTQGTTVTPWIGSLNAFVVADPQFVADIGGRTLAVTLRPSAGTFDGTFSDASPASINVNGDRRASVADAAIYGGRYNLMLTIPAGSIGDSSVPQTNGTATFSVAGSGAVSLAPPPALNRLGDGTAIVLTGYVGSTGRLVYYQAYDAGLSSALGIISIISPGSGAMLSGSIDWQKAATGMGTFGAGFGPLVLTVSGSK